MRLKVSGLRSSGSCCFRRDQDRLQQHDRVVNGGGLSIDNKRQRVPRLASVESQAHYGELLGRSLPLTASFSEYFTNLKTQLVLMQTLESWAGLLAVYSFILSYNKSFFN